MINRYIKENFVIGIQARMSSRRLPGKSLFPLGNTSVLGATIQRCLATKLSTFVLTSNQKSDDDIEIESSKFDIEGVLRGSLNNVLSRYEKLYIKSQKKFLIRVTADNPFTDSLFIQHLCKVTAEKNLLYSRFEEEVLPVGYHAECFHNNLIKSEFNNTDLAKEHVTFEIRKRYTDSISFPHIYQINSKLRNKISCTIDTIEDYKKAQNIVNSIKNFDFNDLHLTNTIINKFKNL
tara:strand:- start:1786 stop:2490 length:705 start_codon:yes stop_codon:yes gene_type:complete